MKNMSDHLMLDRLKLLKIRTVDNLRFSRTLFIENRGFSGIRIVENRVFREVDIARIGNLENFVLRNCNSSKKLKLATEFQDYNHNMSLFSREQCKLYLDYISFYEVNSTKFNFSER